MKVSRIRMLLRWTTLLVAFGLLAGTYSCRTSVPPPSPPPPVMAPESPMTEESAPEGTQETSIRIEKIDGQSAGGGKVPIVPVICEVEGTVALLPEDGQIWVVIRPVESSDYWAQPGPAEVKDGHWVAYDCHFGEPGQHYGAEYDVSAVVSSGPLPLGLLTDNQWRMEAVALSPKVRARRAKQD